MVFLKKYCNFKATSILESMIALCIISVCLYIAILVVASIFTPRTAVTFYDTQNKVNEIFFLAQLKKDSLFDEDENFNLEEDMVSSHLKKITIHHKDSTKFEFEKSFYLQSDE